MICSNYREWFLTYVDSYGKEPEIILKKEHSLRVANNMKCIFKALKLPKDYILLADFIGLFHDIGRFEQWRQCKTFQDSIYVDHADDSAYYLTYEGMIKQILPERIYDLLIYDAIKYHNKLFLPKEFCIKDEQIVKRHPSFQKILDISSNGLEAYFPLASLYAMSIRDADKIDILYQYIIAEYFLQMDNLPVSENVKQAFLENKPIDKRDRKTANDSLILRLAFINDINLTKSLTLIKDRQLLQGIRAHYPDKDHTNEYFDYAEQRLNTLIEENKGQEYVLKK